MSLSGFQRRRRALALQAKQEQEEIKAKSPDFDLDELTKDEIISKLEELKIEYNPRDKKDVLKGLLIDASQ